MLKFEHVNVNWCIHEVCVGEGEGGRETENREREWGITVSSIRSQSSVCHSHRHFGALQHLTSVFGRLYKKNKKKLQRLSDLVCFYCPTVYLQGITRMMFRF